MSLRLTHLRHALLIGSALALVTGDAAMARATRAGTGSAFAAPDKPVILTRELKRELGDGKFIIARRSYEIRFIAEADGWRVDGTLLDAQVDAPGDLEQLAALERTRKDDGLFPLHLDHSGLIVAQRGASDDTAGAQARSIVTGSVELISMSPADKAVAADMVGRMSASARAANGNWPQDLFRPLSQPRSETRSLPLPDGEVGKITVKLDANRDPNGLLEQFERNVVTELGGTRRESSEVWRLSDPR